MAQGDGSKSTVKWKDVKKKVATPPQRLAAARKKTLEHIRALRLAELREEHGMTQSQLAVVMKVSQPRVSKLERGEVDATEVATIRAYVEALGGRLELVAAFGDDRMVVG